MRFEISYSFWEQKGSEKRTDGHFNYPTKKGGMSAIVTQGKIWNEKWNINFSEESIGWRIRSSNLSYIYILYFVTFILTSQITREEPKRCLAINLDKKKIHQYNWMPNLDPWPNAFWLYWSVRRETQWEFPIGWKNIQFGWWKREWDAE